MSFRLLLILILTTACFRASAQTTRLPHYTFVDGAWETVLSLQNPTDSDMTVRVIAYDNDGVQQLETQWLLSPGASHLGSVQDLLPGLTAPNGWLEFHSDGAQPRGLMKFTNTTGGGTSSLPTTTETGRRLIFPLMETNAAVFTGMAVINPNDTTAVLNLTLRDNHGAVLGAARRELAPNAKLLAMLDQLFGDQLPENATLEIDSSQEITGFALTFTRDISQIVAVPASSFNPTAKTARETLTSAELQTSGGEATAIVDNDNHAPKGDAAPAHQPFNGFLHIPETIFDPGSVTNLRTFPAVDTRFFTHGNYLVPAERDIQARSDGAFWNIILSPGKVWSEPEDNGWSRASFPFVLTADITNETHNGVATFLYKDANVSALQFQIVQQTAPGREFTFSGLLSASFSSAPDSDQDHTAFAAELADSTPMLPWSALEFQYGAETFADFWDDGQPINTSMTGFILDGVIYHQPVETKYGDFPYPRYMRHGTYSLSKTTTALFAMLRLSQKYGQSVFDLKITDHVTVNAMHNGWDNVTFADCLNMATGVGENNTNPDPNFGSNFADDFGPIIGAFLESPNARGKLNAAFSYGNYFWGPGEVFRYNSTQTFVLGVAMDNYIKSMEGPDASLWNMINEEIFKPLGIHHAPMMHTIESGDDVSYPLLTYGAYPTTDEIAKQTMLMQNGGAHNGEQILDPAKLAESLFQTDEIGLPFDTFAGAPITYHMSVRSAAYPSPDGCTKRIPFMQGAGGNTLILFPNGVTAFRFEDHSQNSLGMVFSAERIQSFCDSAL